MFKSHKKTLHLTISGTVQGVFFRSTTHKKATALELTGWVKNNPDGTVEALFEGEENNLKEILAFCKKGPRGAHVEKVTARWGRCAGEFTSFSIRRE